MDSRFRGNDNLGFGGVPVNANNDSEKNAARKSVAGRACDYIRNLLRFEINDLIHIRINMRARRTARGRIAAHQIKLAVDDVAREPVAHLLGTSEFWGLPLQVTSATLVPRPDTETLVEAALAAIDEGGPRTRPLRIADLGTGTGALLLALLSEVPNALGVGIDMSMEALTVARSNAERLGLAPRARFVRGHFGAALAGGFDLVVSNPPYIPAGDIDALPPEVKRDPRTALDGGGDGLACYRSIAADAKRLVAPGGSLVMELRIGQERAVANLVKAAGLSPWPAKPDLSGIPRALGARFATIGS